MEPSQILHSLMEKASALRRSGNFSQAESVCQEVLKIDPLQCEALRLLAELAWQQGNVASALQWFMKALRANPHSARTHYELGVVLSSLNRFDEAVAFLRLALELEPEFAEACLGLGEVYFKWSYLDESVRALKLALAQDSGMTAAKVKINLIADQQAQLKTLVTTIKSVAPFAPTNVQPDLPSSPKLPRRELFPHLLNELGLTGIGAEIGVQKGNFSELLMRHWKGQLLYAIDPWREFPTEQYADVSNVPQSRHDEFYRTTIQRLMPFQSRSVIWRMTSREAADLTEKDTLDFCYLDGDHSRKGVHEDISLWYPKLKTGGVFGGHDYIPDGAYPVGVFGVQGAVNEFVTTSRLNLFLSGEPQHEHPSWFVIKP